MRADFRLLSINLHFDYVLAEGLSPLAPHIGVEDQEARHVHSQAKYQEPVVVTYGNHKRQVHHGSFAHQPHGVKHDEQGIPEPSKPARSGAIDQLDNVVAVAGDFCDRPRESEAHISGVKVPRSVGKVEGNSMGDEQSGSKLQEHRGQWRRHQAQHSVACFEDSIEELEQN